MNGPLHGVATKAASAPVAIDPAAPPWLAKAGTGTSNRPARFSVIAKVSAISSTTMRGSCNWNAQPTADPPARSARISAPSPTHISTVPSI